MRQFDLSSLMESTRARKQNRGREEEAENDARARFQNPVTHLRARA